MPVRKREEAELQAAEIKRWSFTLAASGKSLPVSVGCFGVERQRGQSETVQTGAERLDVPGEGCWSWKQQAGGLERAKLVGVGQIEKWMERCSLYPNGNSVSLLHQQICSYSGE